MTKDLTTKAKLSTESEAATHSLISDTVANQNEATVEDFKKQSREQAQGILDRVVAGGDTAAGRAKALTIPDGVFPSDAKMGKTFDSEKVGKFLTNARDARDKVQEKAATGQEALAAATTAISENKTAIRELATATRQHTIKSRETDGEIKNAEKAHTEAEKALKAAISPAPDEAEEKQAKADVKREREALKRLDTNSTDPDDVAELAEAQADLKEAEDDLHKAQNPKRDPKAVEEAKADALDALKKLDGLKATKAKADAENVKAERDMAIIKGKSVKLEEDKTKAEETVKGLEDDLKDKNTDLNRQTAYAIGMTHYMATQTDPSVGSLDPATRRTESAKKYEGLTPEARTEGLERVRDEVKRLKDELQHTEGKAKEAIQKELAVMESEHQAARFSDLINGEGGSDDDITAKLIRKFGKGKGIDDPHIRTLLEVGTSGPDGRKAFYNLASELSDKELSEMADDLGGNPMAGLLGSGDLVGIAGKGIRKGVLQMMALKMSGYQATNEELEELEKSTEGGFSSAFSSAKTSKARKKVLQHATEMASWIKSTVADLPDKLNDRSRRLVNTTDRLVSDLKHKIDTDMSFYDSPELSPARVASRFLSYPTTGR